MKFLRKTWWCVLVHNPNNRMKAKVKEMRIWGKFCFWHMMHRIKVLASYYCPTCPYQYEFPLPSQHCLMGPLILSTLLESNNHMHKIKTQNIEQKKKGKSLNIIILMSFSMSYMNIQQFHIPNFKCSPRKMGLHFLVIFLAS